MFGNNVNRGRGDDTEHTTHSLINNNNYSFIMRARDSGGGTANPSRSAGTSRDRYVSYKS